MRLKLDLSLVSELSHPAGQPLPDGQKSLKGMLLILELILQLGEGFGMLCRYQLQVIYLAHSCQLLKLLSDSRMSQVLISTSAREVSGSYIVAATSPALHFLISLPLQEMDYVN